MPTVTIELSPQARRILAGLQTLPPRMLAAVAEALTRENQLSIANIDRRYLHFPKGGKPTPDGLRYMTGSYSRSLNSPPAVVAGDQVVSSIGSNVKNAGFSYPALHEFGGVVKRKGRTHLVRLRTDARGKLLRQLNHPALAVFAKNTMKRAVERTGRSADHTATYPARAPIQRGITDRLTAYGKSLSAAIVGAMQSPA